MRLPRALQGFSHNPGLRQSTPPAMRRIAQFGALLALTAAPSFAQVTIRNDKHREVPEQKVQLLYRMACAVAAERFHVRAQEAEFRVVLVLGDVDERFLADTIHEVYSIYMDNWDEERFASTLVLIEANRLTWIEQYKQMVLEVLRRSNKAGSVTVGQLRKKK